MTTLKTLVGRTIKAVKLSADKEYLQFETDAGPVTYYADGDCCSESWINHIAGLQTLIGRTVLSTEDVEMADIEEGNPGFSGRQEVDSLYGMKLFTDGGQCDIELRNSSNGYYGGSLEEVGERAYRAYDPPADMPEVREDF